MQAVVGEGATDAAGADRQAGLAELLGQDVRRGLGVEETQTNDLADDLGGTSGAGLGSAFTAVQSGAAVGEEGSAELAVTLFAEAVFGRSGAGAETFAFAFDEHEQLARDLVLGRDNQGAAGSAYGVCVRVEVHASLQGMRDEKVRLV